MTIWKQNEFPVDRCMSHPSILEWLTVGWPLRFVSRVWKCETWDLIFHACWEKVVFNYYGGRYRIWRCTCDPRVIHIRIPWEHTYCVSTYIRSRIRWIPISEYVRLNDRVPGNLGCGGCDVTARLNASIESISHNIPQYPTISIFWGMEN
jgi:hypothetical protein